MKISTILKNYLEDKTYIIEEYEDEELYNENFDIDIITNGHTDHDEN